MRRVVVIGSSCAGKSTLAAALAARLGVRHVELDALHWDPGWVEVSDDEFRSRVAAALLAAGKGWVVDGNYRQVRDLVWPRADAVVWLDMPFPLVLWRAIVRTARRVIDGRPVCNGNRESLPQALSRDSIVWWVITSHARRRREYRAALPKLRAEGKRVVVLRSAAAARRWVEGRRGVIADS